MTTLGDHPVPVVDEPDRLGESPMWHPVEQVLYWCDIPGHALRRLDPATGEQARWTFDTDVACCAPMRGGGILLGMRDGLWCFDTRSGRRVRLADAPYDMARERFNDGKCDPRGRFWVGTIYEPREPALAALYCYSRGRLRRHAGDVTVSNGLAWSPDAGTMYWSDTKDHVVYAMDFDLASGRPGARRIFARFPPRQADQALADYGGRPDGAAVDVDGCYWTAMFEGQRLVRLGPGGEVRQEVVLPVRCATMPAFGGADLRTLYITTAREHRPADELAAQPWAGRLLAMRVPVPGLPVSMFDPDA